MSEWIASAASSADSPSRSVHARVSFSPAVKKVIRSSASRSRPATSSSADSPPSRNAAASSCGQLGELRLELQVDPARPVLDRDHRLRRQRLELAGQLAGVVDQRAARVDMSQDPRQLLDLGANLRVARLRLFGDALEPALDVVAIGDQQLQRERLEVTCGIGVRPEAAQHDEQGVDLPQVAELRLAGAGNVLDPDRRRRDLACVHDLRRARRAARRRSGPCRRSSCRTRRRPCS